jgi:hypothetical protein
MEEWDVRTKRSCQRGRYVKFIHLPPPPHLLPLPLLYFSEWRSRLLGVGAKTFYRKMVHAYESRGCGYLFIWFGGLLNKSFQGPIIPSFPQLLGCYWLLWPSNQFQIYFSFCVDPEKLLYCFVQMSSSLFSCTVFLHKVFWQGRILILNIHLIPSLALSSASLNTLYSFQAWEEGLKKWLLTTTSAACSCNSFFYDLKGMEPFGKRSILGAQRDSAISGILSPVKYSQRKKKHYRFFSPLFYLQPLSVSC